MIHCSLSMLDIKTFKLHWKKSVRVKLCYNEIKSLPFLTQIFDPPKVKVRNSVPRSLNNIPPDLFRADLMDLWADDRGELVPRVSFPKPRLLNTTNTTIFCKFLDPCFYECQNQTVSHSITDYQLLINIRWVSIPSMTWPTTQYGWSRVGTSKTLIISDFYSVNCLVRWIIVRIGKLRREVVTFVIISDNQVETCLIITINDTSTCDLPLIITISTSKNKPTREDTTRIDVMSNDSPESSQIWRVGVIYKKGSRCS